jgi:hypothetical protein
VAADPADTGEKVLAGFAKGREIAIERAKRIAEQNDQLVREALDLDILCGGDKPRGRAGRISRRLRGRICERTVRNILERLSSDSD